MTGSDAAPVQIDSSRLLGPGVIPVTGWRPEAEDIAAQAEGIVPVYAGVAHRP